MFSLIAAKLGSRVSILFSALIAVFFVYAVLKVQIGILKNTISRQESRIELLIVQKAALKSANDDFVLLVDEQNTRIESLVFKAQVWRQKATKAVKDVMKEQESRQRVINSSDIDVEKMNLWMQKLY